MAPKLFTIAIAGNPNCGKTALFNALTGARQSVGNWPGVTVEKKEGFFELGNQHIRVVDLPGTYALFANAEDERAAVDYLLTREADLIVNIIDASNIERNLFLTSQLVDMQIPMVIAANMIDIAEKRGLHLDLDILAERFGVPVIPLSAVNERSITNFISEMAHVVAGKKMTPKAIDYGEKVEAAVKYLESKVEPVAKLLDADARWVSLMYLGNEKSYADKFAEAKVQINKAEVTAILGEEKVNGVDCWILESKAKDAKAKVSRRITWVDKKTYVVRKGEYYDKQNRLQKTLSCENIQQVKGYWTTLKMTMTNVQTNHKTVYEINNLKYDEKVNESYFTVSALERELVK